MTPIIKRHGLDDTDPANYRPISNLNTVSKIVERLLLAILTPHVVSSPSYNSLQSAYRRLHSTETALLKMTNDIYEAMDDGRTALLVALDMSAAFDTIDHTTLVDRLQHTFGVSGKVLRWVASYLHDWSTFVKLGSGQSTTAGCKVGVPQGSALGPLLFTLFVGPLANVTQAHGIKHHLYNCLQLSRA